MDRASAFDLRNGDDGTLAKGSRILGRPGREGHEAPCIRMHLGELNRHGWEVWLEVRQSHRRLHVHHLMHGRSWTVCERILALGFNSIHRKLCSRKEKTGGIAKDEYEAGAGIGQHRSGGLSTNQAGTALARQPSLKPCLGCCFSTVFVHFILLG